jgi:hypothetical protein
VSSSVTYTATLDMRRETVLFVAGLLHADGGGVVPGRAAVR